MPKEVDDVEREVRNCCIHDAIEKLQTIGLLAEEINREETSGGVGFPKADPITPDTIVKLAGQCRFGLEQLLPDGYGEEDI